MTRLFVRPSWKLLLTLSFCGACGSNAADDDVSNTGGAPAGDTGGVPGAGGAPGGGGVPGSGATGGDVDPGTGGSGGDPLGTGGMTSGGGGGSGDDPIVCPSTALTPGDTTRTISVGGTERSYILHVPPAYDGSTAVPLIVDFHPLGGSGQSERSSSPYPAQVGSEGVIMAFPSGMSGPSGNAWNVGPCCVSGPDDVAFARALVADVAERACIDPKRIYAVGFSMGGGMSHYLGCHASDLFAAIAPAAFDLLEENIGDCQPERPLTVVSFRGTSDPIVPYDGGYSAVVTGMPITFLGAQSTFEAWADLNGCTGSPSPTGQNGCQGYSNCDGGVDVVLCTQNAGHVAGDASVAWPILKQHSLP
ncbi:MAG: hypothetical protein GX607_08240 [Myxococcales bacterium]|nr:hypothetical protein [Myxococcales bacterium]